MKEEFCHFNICSDKLSHSINESKQNHIRSFFNICNICGFRYNQRKKNKFKIRTITKYNQLTLTSISNKLGTTYIYIMRMMDYISYVVQST